MVNNVCRLAIHASLMILLSSFALHAQDDVTKKRSYFIDVNKAAVQHSVNEVQLGELSLQYNDAYGINAEIPFIIYNWKRQVVASISLAKTFGLNHFNILLTDVYTSWEIGKQYTCELKDEQGKKYDFQIKPVAPPDKVDPVIDIFVDPVSLECNNPLGAHIVKFYGQIDGGKSPYNIDWYVLNNSRTDFLFQPTAEQIARPGKASVITVDQAPDYYVLFKVRDACGSIQQKMVHMTCAGGKKKINSVFVEPLSLPVSIKQKIQ